MTQTRDHSVLYFEIVVFYENKTSGINAKEICDILFDSIPDRFSCRPNLYRFDVLEIDSVREEAFSIAENSQLVMIVTESTESEIPSFLRRWVGRNADGCATDYAVSFHTPKQGSGQLPPPVQDGLLSLATRLNHGEATSIA